MLDAQQVGQPRAHRATVGLVDWWVNETDRGPAPVVAAGLMTAVIDAVVGPRSGSEALERRSTTRSAAPSTSRPSSVRSRRRATEVTSDATEKATSRGGASHRAAVLAVLEHAREVVEEPAVDREQVLLEGGAEEGCVAEQQRGGLAIVGEEGEGGADRRPHASPEVAGGAAATAASMRPRRASASAVIRAWNSSSLESKYQ